jgi:hypothetical protein
LRQDIVKMRVNKIGDHTITAGTGRYANAAGSFILEHSRLPPDSKRHHNAETW